MGGQHYLANPKVASFHRYLRSAAAPASGNMALILYKINLYNQVTEITIIK